MSTGKRIAKRSILGTRVVAPGLDGRFYPAIIQSVTHNNDHILPYKSENRYLVRFDNSRKLNEFSERELIGPGFGCVAAVGSLLGGQRVYLTHMGREIEGTVGVHDVKADIVSVILPVGSTWFFNLLFTTSIIYSYQLYFRRLQDCYSFFITTKERSNFFYFGHIFTKNLNQPYPV